MNYSIETAHPTKMPAVGIRVWEAYMAEGDKVRFTEQGAQGSRIEFVAYTHDYCSIMGGGHELFRVRAVEPTRVRGLKAIGKQEVDRWDATRFEVEVNRRAPQDVLDRERMSAAIEEAQKALGGN